MMSGAISEETAVESMRAGAQDYVTKQNLARLFPLLERELKEAAARRNKLAAERALRAAEARFHRLVEAMPLGLLISDAEGRITYANAADRAAPGLRPRRALLRRYHAQIHLSHDLTIIRLDTSLTNEPFEAVCITASGASVDVLHRRRRAQPGAGLRRSTSSPPLSPILRSRSRAKRSCAAPKSSPSPAASPPPSRTRSTTRSRPSPTASTSLARPPSPDGVTYLDLAQKELDRVAQITVQTLRFHRRSTRPALADVQDLIETVLAIFDHRLRRARIEVVREFRPIPLVLAHDGEIRQVLANLVGNAMDAVPGGGCIRIRTAPSSDISGRSGVAITIADTGTGIEPGSVRRIFEPFFSTKGITGTGLGLWISQEIINRHHGSLRVRSRLASPGRTGGTAFRIFIPSDGEPAPAAPSEHLTAHEQN